MHRFYEKEPCRLVKVSTAGGAVIAEYAYNGLFRRNTRTAAGKTTRYYYNREWRPVEEREDAQSAPSRLYDWGIRYRDGTGAAGEVASTSGSSGSS